MSLINIQTFLVKDTAKGEPVTPCIDIYKVRIHSDGSLYKLKLRIMVIGDLYNKELFGDTFSPKASTRNLKYFLKDEFKHKARVHQLYFNGAFLEAKFKTRVC